MISSTDQQISTDTEVDFDNENNETFNIDSLFNPDEDKSNINLREV